MSHCIASHYYNRAKDAGQSQKGTNQRRYSATQPEPKSVVGRRDKMGLLYRLLQRTFLFDLSLKLSPHGLCSQVHRHTTRSATGFESSDPTVYGDPAMIHRYKYAYHDSDGL